MFALLSAVGAGLVSLVLIAFFIDILHWLFVPSVTIMVFVSAYFAFRRRVGEKGELTGKLISQIALEVGTLTHYYTFALYLPLFFLFGLSQELSSDTIVMYLFGIVAGGTVSFVMFVWVAVPMYIGVGYIQKKLEKELYFNDDKPDESLLNDDLAQSEIKVASRLELD